MGEGRKIVKKTKKIGRPKKEIDFSTVENLCKIQCTGEEIASVLGVNYDTLVNRIKEQYNENFSEYYKRFSGTGKASLRRLQFKLAEKNAAMCIWLGKQYLGQKEPKDEIDIRISDLPTNIDELSDEEIEKLYKEQESSIKAKDS